MKKKKSFKKNNDLKSKNLDISIIALIICFCFCIIFIKGENIWLLTREFLFGLFGINFVFIPFLLTFKLIFRLKKEDVNNTKLILFCVFLFILSMLIGMFTFPSAKQFEYFYKKGIISSGVLAGFIDVMFVNFFGILASKAILLMTFFAVSVVLFEIDMILLLKKIYNFILGLNKKVKKSKDINKIKLINKKTNSEIINNGESLDQSIEPINIECVNNGKINEKNIYSKFSGNYIPPSIDFLKCSEQKNHENIGNELKLNSEILLNTFENFKIKAKVTDVCRGPSITRYEIQPAPGIKVSKIMSLSDDIALSLASVGVRIEAPIQGKAAVGIEVPNKIVQIVRIREIIGSNEFVSANSPLAVTMGKDISGKCVVADLKKMPHLLIAGSTGSGKSVCVNSFILSIVYNASPDDVKLIMIDPKVVELGTYNGIPHLLIPVVTDPLKAPGVLNWAVEEMLKRYKLFAEMGVKDMNSYNLHIEKNKIKKEKMPNILIIIDELADLMMVAQKEVEDCICRLTQMARAAGMHLVIATQRPSVDIITGVIKANIPSRIALAVSSHVDSRTILDSSGAEKLLGRGDMLFAPVGSLKPTRIQGCYVEDEEIDMVVDYLKNSFKEQYDPTILSSIEKFNNKSDNTGERKKTKKEIFG